MKISSAFGMMITTLALSVGLITACLGRRLSSDLETTPGSNKVTFSFYDPFPAECPNKPSGVEGSIAPSPYVLGLESTCTDNWIDIGSPGNLPDMEDHDYDLLNGKGKARTKEAAWQWGIDNCNGSCVKRDGIKYMINKPTCKLNAGTNCNGKRYKLQSSSGGEAIVYVRDFCPDRHWKNLWKETFGEKVHCKSPHVDILNFEAAAGKLGISRDNQENNTLTITEAP